MSVSLRWKPQAAFDFHEPDLIPVPSLRLQDGCAPLLYAFFVLVMPVHLAQLLPDRETIPHCDTYPLARVQAA